MSKPVHPAAAWPPVFQRIFIPWVPVAGVLALILGLLLFTPRANAAATEPYGLAAMADFERLPYLKLDTMAGGQSSYDRSGGNSDFSNFLRTQNGEKVLLDLNGPGTVYRLWFTGFNPATDYIKVYFDGETSPRINTLLKNMFDAPFFSPLMGDNVVSSGGFYSYMPFPFGKAIRIVSNATAGSFYYNVGYHVYAPDTVVKTWNGHETALPIRDLWRAAGRDPKSDDGNRTVSNHFDLSAGRTQTLLEVTGPNSISAIKLHIPGTEPRPPGAVFADDGRAHKGSSQFRLAINPSNSGVTLIRRLDYGIANQKANVYVDGALVGTWFDSGANGTYHWQEHAFAIPPPFTTGKSSITVKIVFVSSAVDWNEFYYWAWSQSGTASNLTDSLDVGNLASERDHAYTIDGQTWSGSPSFQAPPARPAHAEPEFIQADLLTNLWLKISFDDETNPSVFAPIGSFFAVGQFASYHTLALPVGMDTNDNFYVYFPMPFARHAVVQLISRRSRPTTNIFCAVKYKPFADSFANVGCFKTAFNSEVPTTNGCDIRLLDTEGCGHFVGVVASMMGPPSRSHLEGDERIYVDDCRTPAIYGTGTEDFYNGGWYFEHGIFTQPTHGNPVHLAESDYDYTTAYRLFMQDAVPFRKHIRVGIEHGGTDDVAENVWTLAYYYLQPAPRATLTDRLTIGDPASETAHQYRISQQTWAGSRTYSFDGELDKISSSASGRAHTGKSEFTMTIAATNAGVILRRQFDQGIANQKAAVFVDGKLAGDWYRAGANTDHRWCEADFMIPAHLTRRKLSLRIGIQYLSSGKDWNEFSYSVLSLGGPPAPVKMN